MVIFNIQSYHLNIINKLKTNIHSVEINQKVQIKAHD